MIRTHKDKKLDCVYACVLLVCKLCFLHRDLPLLCNRVLLLLLSASVHRTGIKVEACSSKSAPLRMTEPVRSACRCVCVSVCAWLTLSSTGVISLWFREPVFVCYIDEVEPLAVCLCAERAGTWCVATIVIKEHWGQWKLPSSISHTTWKRLHKHKHKHTHARTFVECCGRSRRTQQTQWWGQQSSRRVKSAAQRL